MNQLKPQLERIDPEFGASFTVRSFNSSIEGELPTWHFHPEIELAYIQDGSGKRHIGSHLSYYKTGDLIMIGPNLPHLGFTNRFAKGQKEVVVQMLKDFLGKDFFNVPEMKDIKVLLERSKNGIRFHGNTKRRVGERLNDLVYMNNFEKVTSFLTILQMLATTNEYTNLNAGNLAIETQVSDNDRIRIVYKYVNDHFKDPISLEQVASLINLTEPAFCRYFKKITKKTFVNFLNEFRIVHACKLIAEEHHTITEVCYECGFNNFSHFAKNFKKITGKTPTSYRKELNLLVY
jgi:YesN/AraC family two-component response regulator